MQDELLDDLLKESPPIDQQRWIFIFKVAAVIQVLAAYGSTVLARIDITSILGTGPIGSVLGFITFYAARKINFKSGTYFGLSAPLLSITCFLVIAIFGISKGDAEVPVPLVLQAYSVIITIGLLRLWTSLKNR